METWLLAQARLSETNKKAKVIVSLIHPKKPNILDSISTVKNDRQSSLNSSAGVVYHPHHICLVVVSLQLRSGENTQETFYPLLYNIERKQIQCSDTEAEAGNIFASSKWQRRFNNFTFDRVCLLLLSLFSFFFMFAQTCHVPSRHVRRSARVHAYVIYI